MGHLAVADVLTVQPYIVTGIHALKIQVSFGCRCILHISKGPYISAAGILHRDVRGINGERVTDVGILMVVIAMILPGSRHRDGIIVGGAEAVLIELFLQIVNAGVILEFPVAGQQLEAVGMLPMLHQVIHPLGSGDEICPAGHGVFMEYKEIFIMLWYDHGIAPFTFYRMVSL